MTVSDLKDEVFRGAASLLTYNKHLWLIPTVLVFMLFSIAIVIEQSTGSTQQATPVFGYRMF